MAESTFEKIMRKSGMKPSSCKCKACKAQCEHTPCIGTPEDMERIMKAGFAHRLVITEWATGKALGAIDRSVWMISPRKMNDDPYTPAPCSFYENGLCILHEKGLKPSEGRLTHHTPEPAMRSGKFSKSVGFNVAKTWIEDGRTKEELTDRLALAQADECITPDGRLNLQKFIAILDLHA